MSVVAGGGAHILVVDDESAILRIVRANLLQHGYRVETARPRRGRSPPTRPTTPI